MDEDIFHKFEIMQNDVSISLHLALENKQQITNRNFNSRKNYAINFFPKYC